MDELLKHLIKIERQKTELKYNDYKEYLEKLGDDDRKRLLKILNHLESYLKELRELGHG